MLGKNFFSGCLTRHVSLNFVNALTMATPEEPISLETCEQQHREHIRLIQENLPDLRVHELDADPQCPDCMFIEDTCVVIGNSVVLSQPGDKSRRGEIPPVLDFWESQRANDSCYTKYVTNMSTFFSE